jgi:hypothetical protein
LVGRVEVDDQSQRAPIPYRLHLKQARITSSKSRLIVKSISIADGLRATMSLLRRIQTDFIDVCMELPMAATGDIMALACDECLPNEHENKGSEFE